MRVSRWLSPPLSAALWIAPLVWIFVRLEAGYTPDSLTLLVVSGAVVLIGELLEVDLRGGRSTPVSSAVIYALFVVLSPFEVLLVIVPALLIGIVVRGPEVGWMARFRSTTRRFGALLVGLGAFLVMAPYAMAAVADMGPRAVLLAETTVMILAGTIKLLVDTAASAAFIAFAQRIPATPIWWGQLQNRAALHAAFLSVAALMALAHSVLSEATFLLFLLPLLAARRSFRRYASIHKTYVQTIRALSKVPELAGFSPKGHSLKVAELATALARDRGLSDNEVQDVEYAALLHDIGRISFDDPSDAPESVSGTPEGAQLARASAEIVMKTPYLENVGRIISRQDENFSEGSSDDTDTVTISARIVKVANDFVELTHGINMRPELALERLQADTPEAYDPSVVIALQRILGRQENAASRASQAGRAVGEASS